MLEQNSIGEATNNIVEGVEVERYNRIVHLGSSSVGEVYVALAEVLVAVGVLHAVFHDVEVCAVGVFNLHVGNYAAEVVYGVVVDVGRNNAAL